MPLLSNISTLLLGVNANSRPFSPAITDVSEPTTPPFSYFGKGFEYNTANWESVTADTAAACANFATIPPLAVASVDAKAITAFTAISAACESLSFFACSFFKSLNFRCFSFSILTSASALSSSFKREVSNASFAIFASFSAACVRVLYSSLLILIAFPTTLLSTCREVSISPVITSFTLSLILAKSPTSPPSGTNFTFTEKIPICFATSSENFSNADFNSLTSGSSNSKAISIIHTGTSSSFFNLSRIRWSDCSIFSAYISSSSSRDILLTASLTSFTLLTITPVVSFTTGCDFSRSFFILSSLIFSSPRLVIALSISCFVASTFFCAFFTAAASAPAIAAPPPDSPSVEGVSCVFFRISKAAFCIKSSDFRFSILV